MSVYKGDVLIAGGGNGSNQNFLINGDFQVNQRGLTTYTAVGYTVDRWYKNAYQTLVVNSDGSITITKTDTTKQRYIIQYIEDFKKLLGKICTISVKYSNATVGNDYRLAMFDGNDFTNYVDSAYLSTSGLITFTFTVPSNFSGSKLGVIFYPNFVSSSNVSITINYIKLEFDSVATHFNPRPYADELAMCQRYYVKSKDLGTGAYPLFSVGMCYSATASYFVLPFRMRTIPTITTTGTFVLLTNGGTKALSLAVDNGSTDAGIVLKGTSTGLTAGNSGAIYVNNDNSASIELDAEIY